MARLGAMLALGAVVAVAVVGRAGAAHENCHDNGLRCHGIDNYGNLYDNYVHSHYTDNQVDWYGTELVHLETRRGTGPQGAFTGSVRLSIISTWTESLDHIHENVQSDAAECRTYINNEVVDRWRYTHGVHNWCG